AVNALAEFAGAGPVCLHSLDLSVGSPEAREGAAYLARVRTLIAAAGVDVISDHLAYSRVAGVALPQFAPLWRVEESLDLVVANVDYLQQTLGVQLALENIALTFDPGGEIGTMAFIREVS